MMNENGVGIWQVHAPPRALELTLPRGPRWMAAALAVLVGAILALSAEGWRGAAIPSEPVATVEPVWAERPLPREWRWSPPGVAYEHMYFERR